MDVGVPAVTTRAPRLVLERGPTQGGLGSWAVDSDGSVLVAEPQDHPRFVVHDCEVPSGRCVRLGPLSTGSGDPLFIGVDM